MIAAYREHDLLTCASAISFQVLFALIPLTLLALGLLGAFDLEGVWRNDVAPRIRTEISPAVFSAVNQTANQVLDRTQLLWVTVGAAFTVWQVSGAVRAVMGLFNRIYRAEERRGFWRRMFLSTGLALIETLLVLAAVAAVKFTPGLAGEVLGKGWLVGVLAFAVRWCLAASLLLLAVALLVRFAPAQRRPWRWVSFGSGLVVLGWVAMSLVFGLYLTKIADYGSVFGSLATLIVVMEYLYIAAIIFVTGIQIDALARERLED
jgi:membrane protein